MKISIITVCYNSEKTIKYTIESVLRQKYEDIEYILVDGKSNDSTVEIIKSYEEIFRKKKIEYKWISEKDKGLYDAINKGIEISSGDVVGIINSDDFFSDEKVIYDIVDKFKKNDIDCLYGNLVYVNSENIEKITRTWISKKFEKGLFEKSWTPAHPTFYCKKDLYTKYGLYRIDFKIASDVELMYRFLEKYSAKSMYYDRMMVKMRAGGVSNRGIDSTITITKELKIAITENGGKFNLIKYLFYKFLKIKQLFVR